MKKTSFFFFLILGMNWIYSQQKSAKTIKEHETFNKTIKDIDPNLKGFVPKDYNVIAMKKGNLNLDKFEDCIMVLRKKTETTTSNMNEEKPDKRPLLILLGQEDKSYKLVSKNENVAYCIDCAGVFGDPFVGIAIKNGFFSMEHAIAGGHHWQQIITFKYNKTKRNWYLFKNHYINYVLNSDSSPNAEALVADVDKLTTVKDFGEIPFQKFNIYSDRGY
ncbi:hypothetical protein [Flavobacterium quisquiliarum]|uniref:Uncharacterized protein n=1 Tax=Flavobacterium quisquiliarum TaxID=1834436 RepID=A0ABV8W215_9FLAO|nr:hypothetical protein [Flavobacterium quisquiliarum]MBW1653919.1 hypothetical protein [Flavobacterium quisquiliarum]NWL01276.1 hypothetical protein [Flavobacterium collinsii]